MVLADLPDAPDIACALRTGYPRLPETHQCRLCGAPAQCFGRDNYWCFDCARRAFDALSDEDAVELLGFEVTGDE